MTNNQLFLLCLIVLLSVGLFGYHFSVDATRGIGVTEVEVVHLTPHAVEVLKAQGIDVPESAITGKVLVPSTDVSSGGWLGAATFVFQMATFSCDGLPVVFSLIFDVLSLCLVYLGLKLVSGFIPTTGGSGGS